MMSFIRNLFVTDRFFYAMASLTLAMMLSYAFSALFPLVSTLLFVFALICIVDIALLFNRKVRVSADREMSGVLSLGDDNPVIIRFKNLCGLRLAVEAIDELPEQFQRRDFAVNIVLPGFADHQHKYFLRP